MSMTVCSNDVSNNTTQHTGMFYWWRSKKHFILASRPMWYVPFNSQQWQW